MQQNSKLVRGLYEPGEFRDNCGFGLISHMEGKASHELLQTAIEALTCMTHRGGINADGKTGDGCGLLLKKPDSFFRKVAGEQGIDLPDTYAVGMVFTHPDAERARAQKAVLQEQMEAQGVNVLGWWPPRATPTTSSTGVCFSPAGTRKSASKRTATSTSAPCPRRWSPIKA